jgi:hypothetical protein
LNVFSIPFLFCVSIFIFQVQSGNSQNLVGNNGFESNSSNPAGYGEWYRCSGWNNVNNYPGFMWPYASPDYLTIGGTGGSGLPNCTFATVNPFTGNAIMGFVAYTTSAANFREYISRPLNSPMVAGQMYKVSFYITNGTSNWYSGGGCNHVGVRLSIGPLTQTDHEPINVVPQCEVTTVLWSTAWKLVTFNYTAAAGFNNITIGNFYTDVNTSHSMFGSGGDGAYYFIDEVIVQPASPLPVELVSFYGKNEGAENILRWSTATETMNDFFSIERSADGKSFESIGKVNGFGTSFQQHDYLFIDYHPFQHAGYYRLKQVDYNDNFNFSETIKIETPGKVNSINVASSNEPGIFNLVIRNHQDCKLQYEIMSSSGKCISRSGNKIIPENFSQEINISNFSAGIYFLRIQLNDEMTVEKIIKN